jgi:hypothetical protein
MEFEHFFRMDVRRSREKNFEVTFLSFQLKECLVFQVGVHFFELSTDLIKFLMGHSIGRVKRGYLGGVRCTLSVRLDFFYFYGLPLQPFLILVLSLRVLWLLTSPYRWYSRYSWPLCARLPISQNYRHMIEKLLISFLCINKTLITQIV